MKLNLDKRIPSRSCIFTCFDTESAKQYIGKQGYFTNCFSLFTNINSLVKGTLTKIYDYSVNDKYGTNVGEKSYSFFLPKELLKTEEKKLRPYVLNEFFDKFTMLSRITFREKGNNDCIITCVVNGYRTRLNGIDVCLGVEWISLGTLFDEYEYKNTLGDWLPFGVEEDDK